MVALEVPPLLISRLNRVGSAFLACDPITIAIASGVGLVQRFTDRKGGNSDAAGLVSGSGLTHTVRMVRMQVIAILVCLCGAGHPLCRRLLGRCSLGRRLLGRRLLRNQLLSFCGCLDLGGVGFLCSGLLRFRRSSCFRLSCRLLLRCLCCCSSFRFGRCLGLDAGR